MTPRFRCDALPRTIPSRLAAVLTGAALALPVAAWAKLPPLSDEAKAKAAETAARAAWTTKVDLYKLCQSMDRVAASYRADATKTGKPVNAAVETPACTDPGAFVYAPAAAPAKPAPLEAAGAHSPSTTAVAPPNTTTPQAPGAKPAPR